MTEAGGPYTVLVEATSVGVGWVEGEPVHTHTPVPEHVYVQHQHAHIGARTQQEYTVAEGKEMIATKRWLVDKEKSVEVEMEK